MLRPRSIVRFEQLFFASAAVMAVNVMAFFPTFADRYYSAGLAIGAVVISLLVSAGLYYLFWFFIARRPSSVAKWVFVALNALGLINLIQFLATAGAISLPNALTLLARLLLLLAAIFLLRRDAVEWQRNKGLQEPLDIATFN